MLAGGDKIMVDRAVLCVGNFPPAPPFKPRASVLESARYVADPWDWSSFDDIERDDSLLLVGTGLTMIDIVIELEARGHRGPIRAISRRGLLPQAHVLARPYPPFLDPSRLPRTVQGQFRRIRAEIRLAKLEGYGWASVMDAVRPFVQALWRALPDAERRRFLRHVRPYWDVHRHRMAPEVAHRIEALRTAGRLTIEAGRILNADIVKGGIELLVRPRREDGAIRVRADWLVNCSGPECDYGRIRHPLIRQLLESGMARPDRLSLGLDVTDDLALVDRQGAVSGALFALGPPTRGALWEITAVPDIRAQCAALASRLLREVACA